MKSRTALILMVGLLIAADANDNATKKETGTKGANATKEDMEKLRGAWIVMAGESAGEKVPDRELKARFVFSGNKLVIQWDDQKEKDEANYELDATKKPKAIDLMPTPGDPDDRLKGIYTLEGNQLKICVGGNEERPMEFKSTKDNGFKLVILRREKK